MTISVRGTYNGPNSHGSSTTFDLPSGTTTGDVSFLACITDGSGPLTFTPPSGWTVLVNQAAMLVCYRAFQSGDPTTGISVSVASGAPWWGSICISYTGLDTTSPIDASNACFSLSGNHTFTVLNDRHRAPTVAPNYDGSQLLCIFSEGGSTGRTLTLPSGLTAQANFTSGPAVRVCDKALTDGTPTGNYDSGVGTSTNTQHFGMSIALKAASASAATLAPAFPALCGYWNDLSDIASPTPPLDLIGVEDGDLVCVFIDGDDTVSSAPTGYTQVSSVQGAQLYTHLWQTGDSLSPAFTMNLGTYKNFDVVLARKVGVSASGVALDTYHVNTASGSSATCSTDSLTPAGSNELLVNYFGSSTNTGVGTWSSVTGGVSEEDTVSTGPHSRLGWVEPAASPTGVFSATLGVSSGSVTLAALSALFMIGAGGGGGGSGSARPVCFVCT